MECIVRPHNTLPGPRPHGARSTVYPPLPSHRYAPPEGGALDTLTGLAYSSDSVSRGAGAAERPTHGPLAPAPPDHSTLLTRSKAVVCPSLHSGPRGPSTHVTMLEQSSQLSAAGSPHNAGPRRFGRCGLGPSLCGETGRAEEETLTFVTSGLGPCDPWRRPEDAACRRSRIPRAPTPSPPTHPPPTSNGLGRNYSN